MYIIYINIYIYIIYNSFAFFTRLHLTLSTHLHRSTTSGVTSHLAAIMHVSYISLSDIDHIIRRCWSELQTASLNETYKDTNITQLDVSTEECRPVSWVTWLFAASHFVGPGLLPVESIWHLL